MLGAWVSVLRHEGVAGESDNAVLRPEIASVLFGARWSRHGSAAIAHHKEVPGSCGGCWGGGRRGGLFQESQALDYPRKEEVTSAHLFPHLGGLFRRQITHPD